MSNFSLDCNPDDNSVSIVTSPEDNTTTVVSNGTRSLPDTPSSETTTITENQLPTRKTVQFFNVNVREYRTCLGDNPAVRRGAPISLGWKYDDKELCYSIEDFEKSEHCALSYPTRSSNDVDSLQRSSLDRLLLLKKLGYSRMEIKEATEGVQRISKQRFQTRRRLEFTDKIKAIGNGILCAFCRPSRDNSCDLDNVLGESNSTTSTRISNDSLSMGTDVAVTWPRNRLQRLRSKSNIDSSDTERSQTSRKIEYKKRNKRENWQERLKEQRKKWQARWQREPCDSLDIAHHRSVQFDLSGP